MADISVIFSGIIFGFFAQLDCDLQNVFSCTLAPSEQKDQIAFEECEKSLGLEPERRFKQSCQCLKSAGIQIQCPN